MQGGVSGPTLPLDALFADDVPPPKGAVGKRPSSAAHDHSAPRSLLEKALLDIAPLNPARTQPHPQREQFRAESTYARAGSTEPASTCSSRPVGIKSARAAFSSSASMDAVEQVTRHPDVGLAKQDSKARKAFLAAINELRGVKKPSWNSWVERAQAKAKAGGLTWTLGDDPPKVRDHDPTLKVKAKVDRAVDEFDVKHKRLSRGAFNISKALQEDITHLAKHDGLRHQLVDVRRQRLVVPDEIEGIKRYAAKQKKKVVVQKKIWTLWDSIWVPRVKWSDAKHFYDTTARSRSAFELDWGRAATRGLAKFILTYDDGESDDEDEDDAQDDILWGSDEVSEVATAMWDNHELVNMLFDFYASFGSTSNISSIGLNGFSEFVDNFKLVDGSHASTKKSSWDQMFVAVDSTICKSNAAEMQETYNNKKTLNRQEFYSAVVRAAVMKYVQTKKFADVSQAVQHFIDVDLRPQADPALFTHANEFRKLLYNQDVDVVLKRHEEALRLIFACTYKRKQFVMEHGGLANKLVSYNDWIEVPSA